jgi:hypothetical protein
MLDNYDYRPLICPDDPRYLQLPAMHPAFEELQAAGERPVAALRNPQSSPVTMSADDYLCTVNSYLFTIETWLRVARLQRSPATAPRQPSIVIPSLPPV